MSVSIQPGSPITVEARPRPGETIAHRTCDVCGRAELVSAPGPDAFAGWQVVEGQNNSPWTICAKCNHGEGR
jgi:hypothetical protein